MDDFGAGGHDLYELLGVEPNASGEQIARAYRRLARRYHPDVNASPHAAGRFVRIAHAYQVLSDPAARARYDASRASHGSDAAGGRRARTTESRPRGSPWAHVAHSAAHGANAFWLGATDTVDPFHLGGLTGDGRAAGTNEDEAQLDLSIEEAYLGATRTVTVTSHGNISTLQVAIPPGMVTGDRLRVPLQQLPSGRDANAIFLRVQLAPHERYRVDGRDVHVDLPLSPWEAALGRAVAIDTPAGPVALEVPSGTSTGDLVSRPGRGLPNPSGPPGDLVGHARLVVPARLTPTERDLFTQLAGASTFNPRRG